MVTAKNKFMKGLGFESRRKVKATTTTVCSQLTKMASRNIPNSSSTRVGAACDSTEDEEISRLTFGGTKPKPPKINYGDRMPFREGWKISWLFFSAHEDKTARLSNLTLLK